MAKGLVMCFVKYPVAGRVKTRLARSVGDREAARCYRVLAEHNFAVVQAACQRDDVGVVFDPPEDDAAVRTWLPGADQYWPQVAGDLSARLTAGFQRAFEAGYCRVIVVGSDTLGLAPSILTEAMTALEQWDTVIGPSEDGGYYLIGTRRFWPFLFEDISWSTDQVLRQTRERMRGRRLTTRVLPVLEDLDEGRQLNSEAAAFLRDEA